MCLLRSSVIWYVNVNVLTVVYGRHCSFYAVRLTELCLPLTARSWLCLRWAPALCLQSCEKPGRFWTVCCCYIFSGIVTVLRHVCDQVAGWSSASVAEERPATCYLLLSVALARSEQSSRAAGSWQLWVRIWHEEGQRLYQSLSLHQSGSTWLVLQ